jgi:hypothetical protein
LFKKDGRIVQISGVGRKLLYEIYPWLISVNNYIHISEGSKLPAYSFEG